MKRLLTGQKKKIVRLVKGVLTQPGRYGFLSKIPYPIVRLYARFKGVGPIFLKRADRLRVETESDLTALQFLYYLSGLTSDRETKKLNYDLPSLLATEEERSALRELLTRRLGETNNPLFAATLKAHLMRLENVDADSEDFRNFLLETLQSIINEKFRKPVQSRDKYFSGADARIALEKIDELFLSAGKRFFLDRGTLLGAIRENDFLSNDYDIDLGVLESDVSLDEIREILSGHGFALIQNLPWKLAYISDLGITIDFFLTRQEGDLLISRGMNEIHQWNFKPFTLERREILGASYFVPTNPEDHLTQIYGNWQTPNLYYDPSFDELNVTYVPKVNAAMYLTHRFETALRTKNRYNAERCLTALAEDFGTDLTDVFTQGRKFRK